MLPLVIAQLEVESVGASGADEKFVRVLPDEGEVVNLLVTKLDDVAHLDGLLKIFLILGLKVDESTSLSQSLGNEAKTCL